VNKIPSFIKLDEVVRKLANEGKDTKSQRLMNLEAKKSDMRETLGRRWTQLQSYVISLVPLLADSLPTERAGEIIDALAPEVAEHTSVTTAIPTGAVSVRADEEESEPVAFGTAQSVEETDGGNADGMGVTIDGVVYAQAEGPNAAAVVDGEPQADATSHPSTNDQVDSSDDATGDAPGEAERAFASNAFAVSGRGDGSTFLVINSHQPWAGPFSWYSSSLSPPRNLVLSLQC
jgi:acyl-homoserine lactone acylase PvdQ